MKKPWKSCFASIMKIRVCECSVKYVIFTIKIKISGCVSVLYNDIFEKDFRLCYTNKKTNLQVYIELTFCT